ncbi:MAG: DNA polymerase III subunit gamma/tau [Armatimonadetes bacterium]|nr:DNA polymerase III subunit gamma/tau [Armatimonadota bacterium]MDE2207664.1 DNA polymerase III subunit gamma/tau [Armatimonadota bacterium]
MTYVALYRKYRSQTFDEVMGQEHITTTLRNAIRLGRIGHAYLFYGARGCGKTSTARLLARAVNCAAGDGPTPDPCGVCSICTSIRAGSCMDVMEMDAASETGIDDVREKVIENVQYAPVEARYRVYIIDEVHDLSAKAFDALLKTLEEPPPHVIFILATTELQKVPVTIRSRCQPFHFRRGGIDDLARAVQRVVDAEAITADAAAVRAIARAADGSWRDALSILEQVLAYSDGGITLETVERAIGAVSADMLDRIADAIVAAEWDTTLALSATLVDGGRDIRQLISGLAFYLRDLMLVAVGARGTAEAELGKERVDALAARAAKLSPAIILRMMDQIAQAERDMRVTSQHRWLFERTLLEMCVLVQADPGAAALPRDANSRSEAPVPADRPRATTGATHPPSSPTTPAPAPMAQFAEPITAAALTRVWSDFVAAFKTVSKLGAAYLAHAKVESAEQQVIRLAFDDPAILERVVLKRNLVEERLNAFLNVNGWTIDCVAAATSKLPVSNSGAHGKSDTAVPGEADRPEVVNSALQLFGGEVVSSHQLE